MEFNFKKSLEGLDYSTPEGIAKDVLQELIDYLKASKTSLVEITSLSFSAEQIPNSNPTLYAIKTYMTLKWSAIETEDIEDNRFYFDGMYSKEIPKRETAISIIEEIAKELRVEGFTCTEISHAIDSTSLVKEVVVSV